MHEACAGRRPIRPGPSTHARDDTLHRARHSLRTRSMRLGPGNLSDVVDRRGGGGFSFGRGPQIGCGGAIILLVLSLLTGKNFFQFFDSSGGPTPVQSGPASTAPVEESAEERQVRELSNAVVTDSQNVWEEIFRREGLQYQRSKLVFYRDMTQTSCGLGQAASGPFYCPADGKVYLDLSFFDRSEEHTSELQSQSNLVC